MSETSEQLQKIIEEREELLRPFNQGHDGVQKYLHAENEVPGVTMIAGSAKKITEMLVKNCERYFAGTTSWENGIDAAKATSKWFAGRAEVFLLGCFAKGVFVGRHSEEFKGLTAHGFVKRTDEDAEFSKKCSATLSEFSDDLELITIVSKELFESMKKFIVATDIANMTGRETNHIWDAWRACLGAGAIANYVYGLEFAKREQERKAFELLTAGFAKID